MLRLSRTVAYAVRATLQLAEAPPGIPIPCSRLAAEGRMPERFLLQILRHLVNYGILESTRGVDGGYRLKLEIREISLLDVIEAIDGELSPVAPKLDGELPKYAQRQFRMAMDRVTRAVRHELDAVKLSHLLPSPPPPDARRRGAK